MQKEKWGMHMDELDKTSNHYFQSREKIFFVALLL